MNFLNCFVARCAEGKWHDLLKTVTAVVHLPGLVYGALNQSATVFQQLLVICALLVYVVTAESTEEAQAGRSRVSDEQLNTALSDQRYLRRQLKCALGEAPCDPVGRRLKSTCTCIHVIVDSRSIQPKCHTTSSLSRRSRPRDTRARNVETT